MEDCMRTVRALFVPLLALAALAPVSAPASAEPFPPITDGERALTALADAPNAPAVVLSKKAELLMAGYSGSGLSSHLLVQVRTKILTDEGRESWGDVAIPHCDYARLHGFEGRTVLPDGTVVPVPADAKFKRKISQSRKVFMTSVAFPAVQKGAILDYRYELVFDSIYFLEPWYFADEVPVLHAEITYKIPKELKVRSWSRDPFSIGLHQEPAKSSRGTAVRVWADRVPAVQIDPFGLPFADLAAQMMIVPAAIDDAYRHTPLLDSWQSVCETVDTLYDPARRKDGGVGDKAREIAGQGAPRDKAQALYRFVRDQVATDDLDMIFVPEGSSVKQTLAEKRGNTAAKALLLQSLLAAVKVPARLVWAGDRRRGQVDPALPNPFWFDRVLVALDLEGQRVYLDPGDRDLGFGQLSPHYEGTPAMIFDRKKPEGVVLPETPFERNAQKAVLDLGIDAAGRLAGSGEMVLTGHHAWERIHWKEDDARTAEAWKEWLGDRFKEFKIAAVKVEESPDERRVRLTWSLEQREDEVLGDEATLAPSRPLGPTAQPFVQAGDKRRSPVLFSYADRDEVELRLHWPEGWKVDQAPALAKQENALGGFTVSVEADAAGRTLVYRRQLDIKQKQLASLQQYEVVRALYAAVEKSDAQALSLVRR
jgi:transglutaminase-like putative cysteine protease